MLYTHGGGWGGGDKFKILRPAFLQTLRNLLDQGVACASIEYRLTRPEISNAIDAVADCKDAANYLVSHAEELGLDPERIGVWGGSAGGHLALMTGLAPPELFTSEEPLSSPPLQFRCIVSYFPATTFMKPELMKGSNFERPSRMVPLIGGLAKDHPERGALLSPTEHLRSDSPPSLLIHGDQDTVLPLALSRHFIDVARSRDATARLLVMENGEHGLSGEALSPSLQEVHKEATAFILEHLKAPTPK